MCSPRLYDQNGDRGRVRLVVAPSVVGATVATGGVFGAGASSIVVISAREVPSTGIVVSGSLSGVSDAGVATAGFSLTVAASAGGNWSSLSFVPVGPSIEVVGGRIGGGF